MDIFNLSKALKKNGNYKVFNYTIRSSSIKQSSALVLQSKKSLPADAKPSLTPTKASNVCKKLNHSCGNWKIVVSRKRLLFVLKLKILGRKLDVNFWLQELNLSKLIWSSTLHRATSQLETSTRQLSFLRNSSSITRQANVWWLRKSPRVSSKLLLYLKRVFSFNVQFNVMNVSRPGKNFFTALSATSSLLLPMNDRF